VLCQYTVFVLFHLGAVYILDRLCVCVCGFKTYIGLCSFPKYYFLF
jgi:hypothetical protein